MFDTRNESCINLFLTSTSHIPRDPRDAQHSDITHPNACVHRECTNVRVVCRSKSPLTVQSTLSLALALHRGKLSVRVTPHGSEHPLSSLGSAPWKTLPALPPPEAAHAPKVQLYQEGSGSSDVRPLTQKSAAPPMAHRQSPTTTIRRSMTRGAARRLVGPHVDSWASMCPSGIMFLFTSRLTMAGAVPVGDRRGW